MKSLFGTSLALNLSLPLAGSTPMLLGERRLRLQDRRRPNCAIKFSRGGFIRGETAFGGWREMQNAAGSPYSKPKLFAAIAG